MAWELVKRQRTLTGWFFIGQAEEATFDVTLPPEELPGMSWFADRITSALVEAARGEGQILETEVYFDPASWYDCKYRVIARAHGSPIAWTPIIVAALAVIALAIIAWTLRTVESKPWLGIGLVGVGIGAGAFGIAHLVKSTKKEGT